MESSKTILLLGGGGFVGGNLARMAIDQGWQAVVADSTFRPGLQGVEWQTVDLTHAPAVENLIDAVKPAAVVDLAAIADIDVAEREQELAWKVNVDAARFAAESCARHSVRMFYFSSDAVFDGEGKNYTEGDTLAPTNYYGYTKAAGEAAVLAALPKAVILRISLVLGFPVTGGNSFLAGLDSKLASGAGVEAPTAEIRTPVDVLTLCQCVVELAESDQYGVFHIGATSSINRYELTRTLALKMGYPVDLVQPASQVEKPGRAPRHKNGIISVGKAQRLLHTPMLSLDETLDRAIHTRRKK